MRVTTGWILAAFLSFTVPAMTPAQDVAPAAWGSWSFDLLDDSGRPLPTFLHGGRTYVLGTAGRRYQVRVRNESGRRAEVVVSVDGRDVIDGGPSSMEKRGYLVDGHGEVRIDGYRLSESAVAAFRFGTVARSPKCFKYLNLSYDEKPKQKHPLFLHHFSILPEGLLLVV